ncbi:MAG: amidohydrolase family protein [Planctomycetota bacterium]
MRHLHRSMGDGGRRRVRAGRVRWRWIAVGALLVVVALPPIGLALARRYFGATSSKSPDSFRTAASEGARALVDRALEGLDPHRIADYHAHVAGVGAGGSGCEVSPKMLTWLHPRQRVQFLFYMDAGGVSDLERADEQYVARLRDLVLAVQPRARLGLLAFDRCYTQDGARDDAHTAMHVPNEYVLKLVDAQPDLFRSVISVHPYRKDAVSELDRWAARGARVVKWLPNAMGIDPADPRCDAFYDRLKHWNMALLTHAGEEQAVDSAHGHDFGNPLRLRRALDRGVKVIVAHCATLGDFEDSEDPARSSRPAFELFLRLMDDPRYEGLAFGEISAICQSNRDSANVATLLARSDLHARLVNGSDWPLPAIDAIVSTRAFESAGFLTRQEREALDELYDFNPWLFDLVLKRTLHNPQTGAQFSPRVFEEHPLLPL